MQYFETKFHHTDVFYWYTDMNHKIEQQIESGQSRFKISRIEYQNLSQRVLNLMGLYNIQIELTN
jgi:hypothetical protein